MTETQKKTIVAIGPLPPPATGQSLSFRMLLDELEKSGDVIPVDIGITESPDQSKIVGMLMRVYSFVKLPLTLLPIFSRNDCRVYLTISQSRRGFLRDYIIILIASWFKRPVVAHLKGGNYHGFYLSQGKFTRRNIRKMLRKVETLVVLSTRLVGMYDFDPALPSKVVVVENGLPFDMEPSSRKDAPTDAVHVLYLSNLIESKGYLDLLDAIALCKDHNPPVHIHYAGNFQQSADDLTIESVSHAKQIFKEKIERLGISDRVTYHGVVANEEKVNLLHQCHMLALPTRYIYEGQPVSIIEALGFGMPIIASDYRANTDMVHDKETGVLVRPTRVNDMAKAIRFIADPSRYEQLSQNCLDLFNKKFTRRAHLNRLTKHL